MYMQIEPQQKKSQELKWYLCRLHADWISIRADCARETFEQSSLARTHGQPQSRFEQNKRNKMRFFLFASSSCIRLKRSNMLPWPILTYNASESNSSGQKYKQNVNIWKNNKTDDIFCLPLSHRYLIHNTQLNRPRSEHNWICSCYVLAAFVYSM